MSKTTYLIYFMNGLISVERNRRSATLDIDTLRDGDWWLPAVGVEQIKDLLREFCIQPKKYQLGARSLLAWGIPVDDIDGLIIRMSKILARYRCAHATLRDVKAERVAADGSLEREHVERGNSHI